MANEKNICIIHFNTPALTKCLVMSINKYVPNAKIFIFDNSDKSPFVNIFDNVTVFDNTKGQIINFEEWLKKYPNRGKAGKTPVLNKWASAKHCYSVEKCIELINENFVLLDSDILLKKSINEFFDDRYIFVGTQEKRPGLPIRLLPYLCFINVDMMKKNNIHYFDETMMNGLMVTKNGNVYDTGAAFVVNAKNLPHKSIEIKNYMVHYAGASWQDRSRITTQENWLKENKKYWETVEKKSETKLLVSLTSYKERIETLPKVFDALLSQTKKPDKIVLTVFKDDIQYLTDKVKNYFNFKKVELLVADKNLKPHLKYFYTMQKYRDYCIVTVDDDMIYSNDMLESLYNSYKRFPDVVSARRVHKIKKDAEGKILPYNKWGYECKTVITPSDELFATGVGGVLYPPNILKISDENLPEIYNVLTADDIYLKYLENKLGIKVLWVKNGALMGKEIKTGNAQLKALNKINVIGKKNDDYIKEFLEEKKEPEIATPKKESSTSKKFSDVFDHIYCLHYLPATDRLQKIKNELARVGINEKADYFSWVYDYPTPLLDLVYNDKRLNMHSALKSSSRDYIKRVSMKHYQIVKEAYSLGYERILILENDIRFHRDMNYISTMLQNIPDTDVVLLDKMVCSAPSEDIKYKRYVKTLQEGALYGDMNDSGVFFIFCSCYTLSRKAMKHIIDAHEKNLLPPDTPLNDKTLTGSFAIINLAIQDPKLKTRKSETYDKIGLNTGVYGPVSDEEKVIKNDSKPEQVAKPQLSQQVKPKPVIKPKVQKQDNSKKVVFRVPTKPQLKKKIEVDTSKKPTQEKQVIKHTKPIVTRMVNPKKTTRSRIIVGKSSGFNKLYDV